MFCTNNNSLWIILILIILFGCGNNMGCGCGSNNGCGCGCNDNCC